ncbi:glucose-6-phosphate isomerase [Desulfosoma caldarium]|uniref:Glucose-6-phosphate isomerase n=1 Tax=Desulfosoma caldarium TaxID=610254 RepID=A0A3N1VK76_9BACT|nr:glucose-6-phosphate isomerase [Desulfosoma caldarium]ROR03215.1 glucose-6-phosphate isomerase/transaldolase/glucose-6-phosphate isomerase [Desulfosoma caldarium]
MPSPIVVEGHWQELAEAVQDAVVRMEKDGIVPRIWNGDHTVWKQNPREISNRLGWLQAPWTMQDRMAELEAFAREVQGSGFEKVVLLGMGGSSLAPEVLSRMFSARDGFPTLTVLDSTHPDAITRVRASLDLSKTLFIVATKSGGTVETLSLFKYFYNQVADCRGARNAGAHFCAITDPQSGLEALARSLGFRKIFLNDPHVGGRYSALTLFGLVPAALVGIDGRSILERAQGMVEACRQSGASPGDGNPGLWLGAFLGAGALQGRDKATVITDPLFANFGDWVEQLIAESTGKEGKGIVPVVNEPLGHPGVYGRDRLFITVSVPAACASGVGSALETDLSKGAFPFVCLRAKDPYDVGSLFFLWEFATVVAGHLLGIHPFDQPDVESAKVQAKKMLAAYRESGALPQVAATLQWRNVTVIGEATGSTPREILASFVDAAPHEGYVGLQAYVAPSPTMDAALRALRKAIRDRTTRAVTVGYGPRFLHSTGQLHKGDAGKGVFVQITDEPTTDVPIPEDPGRETSRVTFGALIAAQALGDREALLAAGRPVLRLHLVGDVPQTLHALAQDL